MLKRVGGRWVKRQVDGDKFICMDRIHRNKPCLIYSFGVHNDWSFEDMMDGLGCTVMAYDHTVHFPERRGRNIHFFKIGLGNETNMDSLNSIIINNGHRSSVIEYLKVRYKMNVNKYSLL